MTESALSDEADAFYQPLGDLAAWIAVAVPAWSLFVGPGEMVVQGALLAAAHESAALDGVIEPDPPRARALLRGTLTLSSVDEEVRAHVKANYDALRLAQAATDEDLHSEAWLRRLHGVACRPQLTHPVRGETGVHDHVLATGDYKHHPNHALTPSGRWIAHAPVALLRDEMARLFQLLASPTFAGLHPFVRAAFAHHAVAHVAPFADGNGRVARALASAHLLRATSLPFLVFSGEATADDDPAGQVAFVARSVAALAELIAAEPPDPAAVRRWDARTQAALAVESLLPAAVERALARHGRRVDLGWLSPLTDVVVSSSPVTITVPSAGVAEVLPVDAQPVLDDNVVVLRAEEAQLRLDVRPDEVGDLAERLDPWLDRVVSVLALRVAAELEPD
jgi:Fic/DOC family protein